jgi:hypothetical protein
VDNVREQYKLEARKMLLKREESHLSSARFVSPLFGLEYTLVNSFPFISPSAKPSLSTMHRANPLKSHDIMKAEAMVRGAGIRSTELWEHRTIEDVRPMCM